MEFIIKKLLSIFIFLSSAVLSTYCMEDWRNYITEIENRSGQPFSVIVYGDPLTFSQMGGEPELDETTKEAIERGDMSLYEEAQARAAAEEIENLKKAGYNYQISKDGKISQDGKNMNRMDVKKYSGVNIIEIEIPAFNKKEQYKDRDFSKSSRLIINEKGDISIQHLS